MLVTVDAHVAVLLYKASLGHQRQQFACAVPGTPRLAVWDVMAHRQAHCDRYSHSTAALSGLTEGLKLTS